MNPRGALPHQRTTNQKVISMAEVNSNSTAEAAAAKTAKAATQTVESYAATAQENLEKFDVAVPEAFRSAAENVVNQSREAYERSKGAMEGTVEMLEKSFDKTGQGSAAINRKVIDIMQTNVNSGFEFARDLAGARNVAEVFERQAAFARKQFETFASQAQELGELSSKVANESVEPFHSHMSRSMENVKVN
jgi:phasin